MEKSKRIDPKQCVQILALYRLLKINQAGRPSEKPSPSFCYYQLPVTFTTCVQSEFSPCVLFIGLRITEQEMTVGKYWYHQWIGATHLLFIFMEMWLPIEIWHKKGPPHLPPQTNVWLQYIPQFTVPREQFLAWGRAVLCGAKPVIHHPEVPPETKASLRVSLRFKA